MCPASHSQIYRYVHPGCRPVTISFSGLDYELYRITKILPGIDIMPQPEQSYFILGYKSVLSKWRGLKVLNLQPRKTALA